ncbi:hypothetical protein WKW79_31755 [Variovorax robiniae]|uniref:Flavin reductase n=1 Tax=Variovorax robiniae TaxID=1836199 RepID=A0ABU8XH58_9BURK
MRPTFAPTMSLLPTGSIGPRPIALVTSLGADGLCNAEPFSAFSFMGEEPPLFVIAIDSC